MKGTRSYDIMIVLLFAGLGAALQVLRGVLGMQVGAGFYIDLVAVPALLAFFLYGFRSSLAVLLLVSAFIALTEPDSWLGASMKLAATLPMVAVPAFYALSMKKGFAVGKPALSMFFALFIALFAFVLWEASTAPVLPQAPGLEIVRGDYIFVLPLGSLLLGLLPLAALLGFSGSLVFLWRRYSAGLGPLPFEQPRLLLEVLLVALFIRCAAMAASTYYYAGPVYWGVDPYRLMAGLPWYAIFAYNIAQGALEMLVAWVIAFKLGIVEKYAAWQ